MKKIFTMLFAALIGLCAQAQANQGQPAAGVSLLYGSEIESMGLGARFQYGIIDQLRGEVEFDYFFKRHQTNWCDINLNAHYLLSLKNEVLYIYPLVGLNYTITSYKGEDGHKHESNHVGLNLGAGMEYNFADHWAAVLQYRHTIIRKVDQGVFSVGVNYKF